MKVTRYTYVYVTQGIKGNITDAVCNVLVMFIELEAVYIIMGMV